MLSAQLNRMRAEALRRLKKCGYSSPTISKILGFEHPWPASAINPEAPASEEAKSKTRAFYDLHTLLHLNEYKQARDAGDVDAAILAVLNAYKSAREPATLGKRVGTEMTRARGALRDSQLLVEVREAICRLMARNEFPSKVDEVRAELPSPVFAKSSRSKVHKVIQGQGGLAKLCEQLTQSKG